MNPGVRILAVLASLVVPVACGDTRRGADGNRVLRIGHFPNVTHAQALVAHGRTRAGKGFFEEKLGGGVTIEWFSYNAGPLAMEAIQIGTLDLTYVGPSPALNVFVRSKGEEGRVISGACKGGAALVVQGDGRIKDAADFRGRKVGTPQLGNTQDIACRAWLVDHGFRVTQTGGDVSVVPTPNPEQLALFTKGDLDAVWTVEPWVSRLERDAKGTVLLEEKDAVTTVLVASARFLKEEPELARKFAAAHAELTKWIADNADAAKEEVRAELSAETRQEMKPDFIAHCWQRLTFDPAISLDVFQKQVAAAQKVGFLRDAGDLAPFVRVP